MRLLDRRNEALASVLGTGLLLDMVEAAADDTPLREAGLIPRSATDFLQAQARALETRTT